MIDKQQTNTKFHPTQLPSASIRRFELLHLQQERTYKAFDLENFYQNKKLNLQSLKDRISKFKSSQQNLKQNISLKKQPQSQKFTNNTKINQVRLNEKIQIHKEQNSNSKEITYDHTTKLQSIKVPSYINNSNLRANSNIGILKNYPRHQNQRKKNIKSYFQTYTPSTQNPEILPNQQQKVPRQQTSDKQTDGKTRNFKIQPVSTNHQSFRKNDFRNSRYSKERSKDSESKHSKEVQSRHTRGRERSLYQQKSFDRSDYDTFGFCQKKVSIQSQEQMDKLQALIQKLWGLYQMLTKIIRSVHLTPFPQSRLIEYYISDVCQPFYEEIRIILEKVNIKRLSKCIITSKYLENVSIVYLALDLVKQERSKEDCTNLVNFIGYCSSNIIFLLRILFIIHNIQQESTPENTNNILNFEKKQASHNSLHQSRFQFSPQTFNIKQIIQKFELESYKQQLTSILDIVIRMEHNNQIINIVQTRMCMKSKKDVREIITEFLKIILHEKKPFYEHAHYIFEYLSYYVAKNNLYGILPCIQTSPKPFFTKLKFPNSIIIQPYQVLVVNKNKNIYIRAYAEQFIQQISNYCNVIFWSDMLQEEIDPILELFPKKENIYYLYKYHCARIHDQFVKHADRVFGHPENAIIIDRSYDNFASSQTQGMQFPWKGQKKDTKLISLYKILQPILIKNEPIRKCFLSIRPEIILLSKKKKFMTKKQPLPRHIFAKIDDELLMNRTDDFMNLTYKYNASTNSQFLQDDDRSELPTMVARQGLYPNYNSQHQR